MKEILVLGPGCAKCEKLREKAEQAVKESGIEGVVKKITDLQEIMSYGVMMTPGLVVDGKLVSYGRVLNVREIIAFLK